MSMKTQIESFNSRPANERRIIMALALLSVVMFVWLVIIKPLGGYYTDAERNLRAATNEATAIATALAEIKTLQNGKAFGASRSVKAFEELVLSSARDAGISEIKIQIQNNETLALKLEEHKPFIIFKWLGDLEQQYGIFVDKATVTATEKPNLISAEILLKQSK